MTTFGRRCLDLDHADVEALRIPFESAPRDKPYGRVAVWRDPWGNRWDLIEFARSDRGGTS